MSRHTNHPQKPATLTPQPIPTTIANARGLTPLEYMLRVVRDPEAAAVRRDRMAIAAAPYCHPRLAEKGKKQVVAEAAEQAGGIESPWAGDLDAWQQ